VNEDELTGQARTHITDLPEPQCSLHAHVVAPFLSMRRAAVADGIDLAPLSSFRDFPRQLTIWNRKFSGERPMLDAAGRPVVANALSEAARIDMILLWSALPGASRHHWGTDVDLVDRRAIPAGYRVQLTPQEFAPGGPFAPLAEWLQDHAAKFGFFRPYRGVLSGVQSEPWHFSFAPTAENARRTLSPTVLHKALSAAPLLGKEHVLRRIEELHARYIAAIDWP
jgi:LAS superfamily LD-carboxypeptidase LdcB